MHRRGTDDDKLVVEMKKQGNRESRLNQCSLLERPEGRVTMISHSRRGHLPSYSTATNRTNTYSE